ncbi:hypothetical protein FACS1894182_13920 [Bacteroidia bacterium]|nr:hypothetical protein FACS1894182_13920 [Bacteroidia bacterium]
MINADIKDCIGKVLEKVLLECFYMNDKFISIVRLYVQLYSYFDITCCEENVFIREQKEDPVKTVSGKYNYIPMEQNIEWLHQGKVFSIKYLIDSHSIKRGILFIFDNRHNFVYYNTGYEMEDNAVFDIDVNLKLLPYNLIGI